MKVISIVIPVYNEETYVWQLLSKVWALDFSDMWFEKEIIVVNDWSRDWSAKIIHDYIDTYWWKIHYIEQKNSGKWAAIKAGFAKATWDVYIIQDADLEYNPNDIKVLLSYMDKKNLDVCYWSRTLWYFVHGAKYSTLFFFLWWIFLSALTTLLTFTLVTDEPTCYKMYRKKCRDILLKPSENDFAWEPAATMLLLKSHFSYWEKPIHYYPRKQKQWKKIKLRDGRLAIKTLFIYRFSK